MADAYRTQFNLACLRQADLDLLFCATPADIRCLTGYTPVMGTSLAALSREGQMAVIVPEDEADLASATTDAELIPYRPETLERLTTPVEALVEPLHTLTGRFGHGVNTLGTPLESNTQPASYVSVHAFHTSLRPLLQSAFPAAELRAADACVRRMQSIKTKMEIDAIGQACALAARGFAAGAAAIRPGLREEEIAAAASSAFHAVANDGFSRGRGDFFCMSGPNSVKAAGAFARTRSRIVEAGDLVMLHANTAGDGIWTDLTRTYSAGGATSQHHAMRMAIAEARDAALARIRPGVAASAVDAAARSVLTEHGFGKAFLHAVGHGIGFVAANAMALPRLHPLSPDILEAGMTFNIEPAIYVDGVGGMRHCDAVVCEETGPRVLSQF